MYSLKNSEKVWWGSMHPLVLLRTQSGLKSSPRFPRAKYIYSSFYQYLFHLFPLRGVGAWGGVDGTDIYQALSWFFPT